MKKWIRIALVLLLLLIVSYAGWIKFRSYDIRDGGPPLAVRWEGFYHDMNFRDIGTSINQCLGKKIFREGLLFRSAGWFSGWNCEKVGNPQVIYSLNYSPEKKERYFCQSEDGKVIGRYFNPEIKLNNLESLRSWVDEETRIAVCGFLKDIFISILDERKTLLHCDAGRDRTGTLSALLVALVAEESGRLDSEMLDAIECDYRKTKSLTPDKYGRMKDFIQSLQAMGGVSTYIEQTCNISPEIIPHVSQKMQQ